MVIHMSLVSLLAHFVYPTVAATATETIPSDPTPGMLLSYHLLLKSRSSSLEEPEEVQLKKLSNARR